MSKLKTTLVPPDENPPQRADDPGRGRSASTALLDQAEAHYEKSEYTQAEQLSREVLALANGSSMLPPGDQAHALCILGDCCWSTARYDEALEHCHNAFAVAASSAMPAPGVRAASNLDDRSSGLQARALNGTAIVHKYRGDFKTALRTAEHALLLAEQSDDKEEQATGLDTIGVAHCKLGDYPRALEYHARALALAEEIGNKRSISATLCNIGNVHHTLGDFPLALDCYARALVIAEEINHIKPMASILGSLARIHGFLGHFPDAFKYNARALALATAIDDKRVMAIVLVNTGLLYSRIADYPRALDCSTRSLALAEEIGDKSGIVAALGNIGLVYDELDDFPRALDYYARALGMSEEIGDKSGVAIMLGSIGIAYAQSGDCARALGYFERALELGTQIGARSLMGFSMQNRAGAQHQLGNLDAACQGYLDALHHRRDLLGTNEGVAVTLLELGRVSIEQGKPDEGRTWLEEALTLAEQTGEKKTASEAHKEIAGAYAAMGDMAQAYKHITKHNEIEKVIFSEESKKRVDNFNMRVAISEIEHGVEVQKLHITHIEHDLAMSAIQLSAQTDLLDRFRTDLRHITREIEEPIAALKKIKEKLKELPCASIDWPKFEAQFNEVHPEFRAKLSQRCPELTQMEQRIASMVRMGLNSATMSRLFCVAERTIEWHRQNLRTKLGLKKGEDLSKFLSSIR